MRKSVGILVGVVVLAAAGWSGAWIWGKGRIVQEIETQMQTMRDRGGEVSYSAIKVGGFPFAYDGRIVEPKMTFSETLELGGDIEPITTSYNWNAPWIDARASAANPNEIEFTFPEKQRIRVVTGDPELPEITMDVVSEQMRVIAERDDDMIRFRGGADKAGIVLDDVFEDLPGMTLTYDVGGLAFSGVTENGIGSAPVAFAYESDTLDMTLNVPDNDIRKGGTFVVTSGRVVGRSDPRDGAMVASGTMEDLVLSVTVHDLGTDALEARIGKVDVGTQMPFEVSDAAQQVAYKVDMQEITLSDSAWKMADPTGAFPRVMDRLLLDLEGTAVFKAVMSDRQAFLDAAEEGFPIVPETIKINRISLDGLGLDIDATGAVSLETGVPDGAVALSVAGLPGFMESLVKGGYLPPQQAMIGQLMVENFAKREEGSETLKFDLEARDGLMYVNDAPIGAAPAIEQ